MRSRVRPTITSLAFAIGASLALASNVLAAPTWTAAETVRSANDVQLGDADFAGHNVAVAWDEPGANRRRVGFAFSDDNGSDFAGGFFQAASREPAIDLCGGVEPNAAFSHRVGPGNWVIEHTVFEAFDSSFTQQVAPTAGVQHDPDIACAGGRLFVSWFERESGGDRLFVAHAQRDGSNFTAPIDLGFDGETRFFSGLVLAGVENMAYAAFRRTSGDLRFKSWSVGGAPDHTVASRPTVVIGPGTPGDPAFEPVIAADGDKVAVAWMTCQAIVARVSNDQGATWGPIRTLVEHAGCDGDFIAAPNTIAIAGDRIALEYTAFGIVGDGDENLIRTRNDFASFRDDVIANRAHVAHLVGFVRAGGEDKLAAAFQRGDSIRYRRQV